ncbi:hypothetical protein TC41_1285 [Alicyclobacillus acidocaldarius subsp. acidocaldarius Tc-4-1]|uniref:Uncharacterized protein n=1 Tax=Alicyclobacillus acidocaldarius (strain Tc-4-1) TaxID=1048834 RepID=F8IHT5_ALIAT|nr:hypothetical protein TC41_1285 [Alicyclobacillus acidocaldarius subsp. acidocaldarius Tc-4-1]
MTAPAEAVIPYDPSSVDVRAEVQSDGIVSMNRGALGHRLNGHPP